MLEGRLMDHWLYTTEFWVGVAFGAFCGWMLRAVLFQTKEDVEQRMKEGLKLRAPGDDEPSLEETDKMIEQLGEKAMQVTDELRRLAKEKARKERSLREDAG